MAQHLAPSTDYSGVQMVLCQVVLVIRFAEHFPRRFRCKLMRLFRSLNPLADKRRWYQGECSIRRNV